MKKLLLLLPFALLGTILLAFTVDDPLNTLLANLEKLTREHPQEKVHLQFDKPYYSLGEDIWFKAYVVNAEQHMLSAQSNILYVDLLDDRDSVKKTLLLPITNGTAGGNITLPDSTLSPGNYHIYAYTKWMQNYGSEYFFKKDIAIGNALHGSVTGSMQYKCIPASNGRQLTTDIIYRNDSGSPVSSQPATITLVVNGKVLQTEKATTDATGKATLKSLIKDEYKAANIAVNTTIRSLNGHIFSQSFVIRPLATVADVQFFPEGGQLVSGIRTKVGFKVIKPDGLGEAVSGYIADESNAHIAEFRSEHAGMSVFALQPLAGKTYRAIIKHEDGSEKSYPLPKVEADGYVLNVNHIGSDSLSVMLSASAALLTGKEAAIVAQCDGIVQYAGKIKLDRASNLSYISIKKIPTGIIQFTLFTPDMMPVAERLVFIDHNDKLRVDIKPDKTTYDKRGKVNMELKVTDAYGDPAVGNFSIAVTNQDKVKIDEDDENSIMSNLLLTSDIKGYIEKPNYYFNPENPNRQKHLDQLLLTQGWRRFNWADLQANKYPVVKYQPEKSLAVSGTITTLGNKPVSMGKVTLFASTPNGPILLDTTADEKGRFIFTNLDISDSTKLVVKATNSKNSTTVKVTLDKKDRVPFSTPFDAAESVTDKGMDDYLKFTQKQFEEMTRFGQLKNATALKEVTIKAVRDRFLEAKIIPHSSNLDPGSADYVIKKDILEHETIFLDIFSRIPGVSVSKGFIYSLRESNSITGSRPMLLIADGAQIPGSLAYEYIKDLDPQDVAAVEVLVGQGKTIYGNAGAKGVIIITTKRGGEEDAPAIVFNISHYVPRGYSATKEFYSPVYDGESFQTKMADLRSTIYWNGNITTDSDGKASITYYTADEPATYKVTIEGISAYGKLARQTATYTVR